jgi:S-adenosylmethionine synthetase
MSYLFTSESVSEGHPDKIADQISDALLDEFLKQDPNSKVACETLVTTGLAVLSGEVKTEAYVDVQQVARDVINRIGYTEAAYRFDGDSCGVISSIHEQSPDINRGVERKAEDEQGAGDQGMMFGYATTETDNYMPLPIELAHFLLKELAEIRREKKVMTYLRPDSKSQVTIEYDDDNNPVKIDTIVVSTQHDEFIKPKDDREQSRIDADNKMLETIFKDIQSILIPRVKQKLPARVQPLFKDDYKLHVNPTGKFVIGGPHGDTGLTGRKIIVDTYGGKGAHGGGAFSGKDSSKVDRSSAYATRHIAKNMVAAGVADEMLVQVAYAIGVANPVGIYVNTYGTCKANKENGSKYSDNELADIINDMFDLRPGAIIKRLGLKRPLFFPTASYGHFGRKPYTAEIKFQSNGGDTRTEKVEFFTWEKLDYVDKIREYFNM